ncbi:MAG: CHAT domain-containing tetratricopeptide repeat protein [Candidatus Acidiferrales bacterium]
MTRSIRPQPSRNSAALIACVLYFTICPDSSIARVSPPRRSAQSAVQQRTSAENHQEKIPLEPGTPEERVLPGGQKLSYQFELEQGQYATILVDCRGMSAAIILFDTSDTAISQYNTDARSPAQSVEIVAKTSGLFRLDVKSKLPKAPAGTCVATVSPPRQASENETLLQDARQLAHRAAVLVEAGKFDDALEPAQTAIEILERVEGPDNALLALPLSVLGNTYKFKADYPKAEALLLRALKIEEQTADPESDRVYSTVNNLGILYFETGELDKAVQYFRRDVDIRQRVGGADDPKLAFPLINLADVYDEKANYSEAEELYKRAMAIEEKAYGPTYPGLGNIIANLAGLYSEKGDYVYAESLARRALNIYQSAYGADDIRLGFPLINLGDMYRLEGESEKAEPLYQRALKIFEGTSGVEHPRIAEVLKDLADICHDRREFAKAETLYQQALAIREKKLGNDHPDVALTLDGLGNLYRDQGEYSRAEPLYRRASEIQEKSLGPGHPDFVATLFDMSTLQMASGNYTKAEKLLARAIGTSRRNVDLNVLSGSEHQKLAYLHSLSAELNRAITLSASFAPEQPAARDLALTTLLQRKGLVQDVLSDNLVALRRRVTAQDSELLENFNHVTSQLARLVLKGPQPGAQEDHQQRVAALTAEREHLEDQISRRSAEYRAGAQPVTIEAVREALPNDAALVEFVTYKKFLPQGITDSERFGETRYVAYILHPSGEVQWKELGAAKDVDSAVDELRQALRDPNREDVKQLARVVDEKVLQPLRGMLDDATRLLISPDGELNLVPFETLVDEQGHYAIESYSISYLTSGRDLLRLQVARESKSAPLVVANPSFGEPENTQFASASRPKEKAALYATVRRSVTTGDDLSDVYFAPLRGTAQEARTIKSLFPDAHVLTGREATKTALKQANAPRLLHIATHGFFLLDAAAAATQDSSKPVVRGTRSISASARIENPMLRSGLAMAGANLSKAADDNGVLTALEASNLNLWGTKLVTLSACDTGMGEVKNGEGVYGLRRAFFLAGTESLVMSLWPVSDYVTRELMTEYYTGLKNGLGRGEALRQAQLAMLKRKGRQHPFFWASFIQSGEWASLNGK